MYINNLLQTNIFISFKVRYINHKSRRGVRQIGLREGGMVVCLKITKREKEGKFWYGWWPGVICPEAIEYGCKKPVLSGLGVVLRKSFQSVQEWRNSTNV